MISGGDAFNLPAKYIREIGERLLGMENIRRIRFATKGPAVMPMKVLSDDQWFSALLTSGGAWTSSISTPSPPIGNSSLAFG